MEGIASACFMDRSSHPPPSAASPRARRRPAPPAHAPAARAPATPRRHPTRLQLACRHARQPCRQLYLCGVPVPGRSINRMACAGAARKVSAVLYHYPFPDGAFAALAAHLYFSGAAHPVRFFPNTIYDPIRSDSLPLEEIKDVYLLDFVGPPGFVEDIAPKVERITILDHHKTAFESLCVNATADPHLVGMCGGAGESPFYMASATGSLGMLRVLLKTCRDAEEEQNYSILSEVDIKRHQEDDINRVSTVLSISKPEACVLLRNYNWSVSKVHDEWFADEERVRKVVGLPEKHIEMPNDRERPIAPVDLYRSICDSQLIGLSGYTKEGLPIFGIGVGHSTYDKASVITLMLAICLVGYNYSQNHKSVWFEAISTKPNKGFRLSSSDSPSR
ncbi:uncharacterized protein [Zea mays]|uniref:uncharacterized protein n=1 Tax=Zea mays TaxID=4577 RepID=UPI0009A95970|nr:uncharacterized protein LOC103654704 [Zea mays]|eukprot:XP_020407931.1 uncharacterized protein LOC103654704 [Zea mays]